MAESETGVVKTWISPRGFGFLTPDLGGTDVFMHIDSFDSDDEPKVGQRVSYEIANDGRGRPRAVNVRLA